MPDVFIKASCEFQQRCLQGRSLKVGSMKWVVCTSLANSVLRTSLTQELA